MVFEGSCDTEDWSNGCWKFSFAITKINDILKYIQIKDNDFKLYFFHNYTVILQLLLYFYPINMSIRDFFQKHKKIVLTPTFWTIE